MVTLLSTAGRCQLSCDRITPLHVTGKRGMMPGRTGLGDVQQEGWTVVNDGDCVAIFHSIHRVMKAEKILKGQQLEILLIPVPRQLTADCGLAIRFPRDLQKAVQAALTEAGLPIAELWLKEQGDFRLL